MTSHADTPSCNRRGDPPISGDCWYNCTLDDIAGEDKKSRLRKVQLASYFILLPVTVTSLGIAFECNLSYTDT